MKKLILAFVFVLGIFSITMAAEKTKKNPHKTKSTVSSKKLFPIPTIMVIPEDCCDGTTRATVFMIWPSEPPAPVNFMIINDPNGDCPICPPWEN